MAVDLNKNEFYIKKMMKECKARDANKDGFISRDDYEIITQRYKDLGMPDQQVKKLSDHFAKFMEVIKVADPGTKLTYEEMIANYLKASNPLELAENLADGHFEIIDTNEDGKISFNEWLDFYKSLDIDTVYARASFDAMDTNGDGVVSKEEFFAYTLEFYTSAEDKLKSSIMFGPLD